MVVLQERVPLAAPDHLDDFPASAAENALEFLDDLAVAAHRTIQPLQVAVHHEVQVAELFTSSQRNRAQRLRLVTLAIAEEAPHVTVAVIHQPATGLVLHDARLVDRLDRSKPHRYGGELPVVRHQPGVRVRRQAVAVDLAPEVVQLLLGDASLKVGTCIHTRSAVALVKHQVTGVTVLGAAEEIIETHIVECGAGAEAGDVTAQSFIVVVGPHHHGQRIPAHQRADAAFHEQVAGHLLFIGGGNGISERCGDSRRQANARISGVFGKLDQ